MPIYCFKCHNGHTLEVLRSKPYKNEVRKRCEKCGMWMYRDIQLEHGSKRKDIFIDKENDPISHQSKKRSFNGTWIEHLTPHPVFVRDQRQYQELLKHTHSKEKES